MQFGVISALPELFANWRGSGVMGRAFAGGLLGWEDANPRDYSEGNYHSIDDAAYGGGPGMVMQLQPLLDALGELTGRMPSARIHLMAPEGRRFGSEHVDEWLEHDAHIIVCGRYEGIDARFLQMAQPQIWSLGDLVLAGGELAAMCIIETVARHIPGVLGNADSAGVDSFSHSGGLLDYPHYTRPKSYKKLQVPPALVSGNHKRIAAWRHAQQCLKTWDWRPDLLRGYLDECDCDAVRADYAARLAAYFARRGTPKD